jgi:nicotinamidase-related amidase
VVVIEARERRAERSVMIIESPRSTALLLVDPLNDFISEGGKLWPYLKEVERRLDGVNNMRRLLAWARDRALRIVFVPHHRAEADDFDGWPFLNPSHEGAKRIQPFLRGSWGADFHPDFEPRPGEAVVHEHWLHNGFAGTDLDYRLRNWGIDRLVLAGLRGNTCLEATARHAVEIGYHITLVKDATATFRDQEWAATMEINAPTFAHAIVSTAAVVDEPWGEVP